MRRITFIEKKDREDLRRLARKNGTRPSDELHRIVAYYFFVSNTAKRLDLGKPKRKKVIRDKFRY